MMYAVGWILLASLAAHELTYAEAIRRARDHPAVAALEAALRTRERGDRQLGLLTRRTVLSFSPGYRFAVADDRGPEGTVSLSHGFNLGALAQARRSAASDERSALAADRRALVLTTELAVAAAWIELRARESLAVSVANQAAVADRFRDRVVAALEAVGPTRRERAAVELYAARAAAASLEAEAEVVHGRLALAEALGAEPDLELRTVGAAPTPAMAADLGPCRADSPQLEGKRAHARAAEARRREADAANASVLTTGLTLQRESPGGWIGFVNLGVTLPDARPQARSTAKAAEAAERRRAGVPGAERAVLRAVARIEHELIHAKEALEHIERRLMPAARTLAEVERERFAAGEGSVWALLQAEREHLEMSAAHEMAKADLTWAYAQAGLYARHCRRRVP